MANHADDAAFWKRQSRKHENRAKRARKLARKLIVEIRAPSAGGAARLADIEAELDRLYEEKRGLQTGLGEPFIRPAPADGTQEIIAVPSSRKRVGEVPPVPTGSRGSDPSDIASITSGSE